MYLTDLFGSCSDIFCLERRKGTIIWLELVQEYCVVLAVRDIPTEVIDSESIT